MLKSRMKIAALTCTALIVSQLSVGLSQPTKGFSNIVNAKEVTQVKTTIHTAINIILVLIFFITIPL